MYQATRFAPRGILVAGGALVCAASCQSDRLAEQQAAPAAVTSPSFLEFESGHVRPIALSPDGTRLFAVNTPNGSLEIFNVTDSGPAFAARVPIGMEPVAVAARDNNEVWVVNHLSDSVSVVTLGGTPHVTRTLVVGDEPRDIVFAGASNLAFPFNPNTSSFVPAGGGAALSDSALRALAQTPGQEITFTCVPPGQGARLAAVQ